MKGGSQCERTPEQSRNSKCGLTFGHQEGGFSFTFSRALAASHIKLTMIKRRKSLQILRNPYKDVGSLPAE